MARLRSGRGDSEAVVRAVVRAHVYASGHVALFAQGTGAHVEKDLTGCRADRFARRPLFFVEMVVGRIVDRSPVTLEAEIVAVLDAPDAVDVVAVAAADLPVVHLALHERPVDVNLVENLTVGKISGPR